MKQNLKCNKKIEITALFLFAIAYIIISIYHEPWFDEAESWQIAKCASIKDIIFVIPHIEGHPSLWHLILSVPAKLGVPYEIGLKGIGFIISMSSATIILFYSSFPRIYKLLIAFSYFFFYQYGIIVRPYGLMLAISMLIGINLNNRKEHPWAISFLLGMLCMIHAYGILIAGGVAVCIVLEIVREKRILKTFKELLKDDRTKSLLFLFLFACLLLIQIYPDPEAYGVSFEATTPLISRILCSFFTFPVECFLSTSSWFSHEGYLMQLSSIPVFEFLLFIILGLIIWLVLFSMSSKETISFLFIPYCFLALFASTVYFTTHHLGVAFIVIISWLMFAYNRDDFFSYGKKIMSLIGKTEHDKKLLKYVVFIICGSCLLIPIYWCISASVHDVMYDYSFGRYAAKFVKEHNMESCTIFSPWYEGGSWSKMSQGNEDYINTNVISSAIPFVAYFNKNNIIDLNLSGDDAYTHHKTINYEESKKVVEKWRDAGAPDIIINRPKISLVYGNYISYDSYSVVWEDTINFIWKNNMSSSHSFLYVRNDLLDKYGLESIDIPWLDYWINGFSITEDMKERYKNGESIESILDPILDELLNH